MVNFDRNNTLTTAPSTELVSGDIETATPPPPPPQEVVVVGADGTMTNNNIIISADGIIQEKAPENSRSTITTHPTNSSSIMEGYEQPSPSSSEQQQQQKQQQQLSPSQESLSGKKGGDVDPELGGIVGGGGDAASVDGSTTSSKRNMSSWWLSSSWIGVILIVLLGAATCAAFLSIGITEANQDETDQFTNRASDLVKVLQRAWEDYETAAASIHGQCRDRNFTRADFRRTYEYLVGSGLQFQAAQFDPNITREERPAAEEEARAFYAQYHPHIDYRGIVGFETANSTILEPRSEQDFYFPIHYMEPVVGNERAIDLDYHASGSRKRTVLFCTEEGKPALTDRLRLVQETTESAYGVVLMHPGFNLTDEVSRLSNSTYSNTTSTGSTVSTRQGTTTTTDNSSNEVWPRDIASLVIRIPDLLRRAGENRGDATVVYLYDKSDSAGVPLFLGAAQIIPYDKQRTSDDERKLATLTFLPERTHDDLKDFVRSEDLLYYEETILAANKEWIVSVHSVEGTYEPSLVFVILGGVIIFVASMALAWWMYSNQRRMDEYNVMRAASDAEKAALILDNARQATKAERDLNDFIAHEVRNPVAAAMSACSFVKAAIEEEEPLRTPEQRQETLDDVGIIDNALRFVNDLLRNMLDMHRAANRQLKVNMTPTDVLHDVLESVHAMLPQRESQFTVEVDCPAGLVVMTDRLRLKQVCLNLARNSVKFVERGFIRLRAEVVDGDVVIYIEDSGPGIPVEKRDMLFSKFQESLDSLSQGTGIGLFLCKNLVALMDGEIQLDQNYDSGVDGNPGTRFVVNLKQPPIDPKEIHMFQMENGTVDQGTGETELLSDDEESVPVELPGSLSVLFVDDDPILRKLFSRTLRTVAPRWDIREASNGETALRLVEAESFDLIFMDMYMASTEKQLLGTEAVRELRKKGVNCRICGLSANDKETEFLLAGADAFSFKPFPCEARALTQELRRILYRDQSHSTE